ncbi:hypothetical cytosolic protein [Syntrophus aciditrophicus SB]|uniref:Hypothetical cytosolic protein n=1 Tax=Syntrophus aciditrophicus (strain SB) TaxID=56780 RepID=Q2LS77_SYNAS|nr:hypothetical cytosolic protein [Syntrophus aciditrophicus SB]
MIMRMQDYKRKKKGCQIHLSASNGLIIPFGYDSSRSHGIRRFSEHYHSAA